MNIGMSDFARKRHQPGNGYTYFKGGVDGYCNYNGDEDSLLRLIDMYWNLRKPGYGRTDCEKVVTVDLPPDLFTATTATITDDMVIYANVSRRQENEDPYIGNRILGRKRKGWKKYIQWLIGLETVNPDPCVKAYAVLYSKDALLENNGTRSGDYDWEVVALIASPTENEPPHPLTMARNFLQKPGGTYCPYTAEQLAESIYYWSTRATIKP